MIDPMKYTHLGPRVREEDVRWEYHVMFYDCPLSGVVHVGDQRMYITVEDEVEVPYGDEKALRYVYKLIRLPQDVMDEVDRRHRLFQECVGFHTDYTYEGNDDRGRYRAKYTPTGRESEYYDMQKTWPELDLSGEPAGWFIDGVE